MCRTKTMPSGKCCLPPCNEGMTALILFDLARFGVREAELKQALTADCRALTTESQQCPLRMDERAQVSIRFGMQKAWHVVSFADGRTGGCGQKWLSRKTGGYAAPYHQPVPGRVGPDQRTTGRRVRRCHGPPDRKD